MKLSIQQRNNLLTGTTLAAELETTTINHRRFITVFGYNYSAGKIMSLSRVIGKSFPEEVLFSLHCYEISADYYENEWDVSDEDVIWIAKTKGIKGITCLESEILKYVDDFSILVPESHCDNLL